MVNRLEYWYRSTCRKVFGIIIDNPFDLKQWIRMWFKYCMDCGVKLPNTYNRGDVCQKCFDEFDGLTIEEIMGIDETEH